MSMCRWRTISWLSCGLYMSLPSWLAHQTADQGDFFHAQTSGKPLAGAFRRTTLSVSALLGTRRRHEHPAGESRLDVGIVRREGEVLGHQVDVAMGPAECRGEVPVLGRMAGS